MRQSLTIIASSITATLATGLATGLVASGLFLLGCESAPIVASKPSEFQSFRVHTDDKVGCLAMNDQYCKSLYDPTSLGNLDVIRPKGVSRVLQGETRNDFSQVFYQYSRAKIRRKDALPKTLLRILEERAYFPKLNSLLSRIPRSQMTVFDRIQFDRISAEVSQIWSTALDETVLRRMVLKFPGYQKIRAREMPPEYEIELQKERRKLLNQVSLALWREDGNWRDVEATFKALQESYLRVIDRIRVEEAIKKDLRDRIMSVKLVLPGSIPEISDYECSSTTINAYYYRYLNVITVCAGDFNSEDILQTLAHEMAHAIDITRSIYLFKMKSELAQQQKYFRKQLCSQKKVNCGEWSSFKEKLPGYLNYFDQFKPELKTFNQCLKRRATTKSASGSDYERIAQGLAVSTFSSLAGADYFLRITKDKLPLKNGNLVKNPYYLNPCAYYLWTNEEEPPEDEINSLVYFTAEYTCGNQKTSDRFRNALDASKKMTEQVLARTMATGGEFASGDRLINEGYASPPSERYADVVGSYAIAEFFNKNPSVEDRRGKYLASISWLCSEPSLKTQFPDESKVENDFYEDIHTDGVLRFQEMLSAPIRSSLQCHKDFEFNECTLPMK